VASVAQVGGFAQAEAPAAGSGWTVAFADHFEGPAGSLPSSANWRFSIGHGYPGGPDNWGTGEIAYHTDDPANVSLDGSGHLEITPLRDEDGDWTSARIETNRQDFRPPPGGVMRIESRLQIPAVTGEAALGYWPAFWALGSPFRGHWNNWPEVGEIDVMENVNGEDRVWGVLHCGVSPGGPCDEPSGIGENLPCPGAPCPGSFHEYTFEWDASTEPNEQRWYVDGQQYHRVGEDDVPAATWEEMTDHAGYFIILNVAIGGGFPDGVAGRETPTADTVPGHPLIVDDVVVRYLGEELPNSDTNLRLNVQPKRTSGKVGKQETFRAIVRNTGDAAAAAVEVCAVAPRMRAGIAGRKCFRYASLAEAESETARFKVKTKRKAAGKKVTLRFTTRAANADRQTARAALKVKKEKRRRAQPSPDDRF